MRRVVIILSLCLVLLFVPIYLWKVQGWWSETGLASDEPNKPYDPSKIAKVFDPIDTSDFQRGIYAGALIAKDAKIDRIELLAQTDAVEMLRECLVAYRETVRGYTCTLCKQERIKGKLNGPEVIEAWFQEEPFSVLMHWKEGGGPACATLYVANQNNHKVCVRPKLGKFIGYVERAPDAADVMDCTRYMITEFGIRCGTERTYKAWKALRDSGVKLQVQYLGLQRNVVEAGGRDCHVIKRICNQPEEEGLTEITLYIDAETWFQVGSVLKANDELIGSYWFKDIKINPMFDAKQFTTETLKKY